MVGQAAFRLGVKPTYRIPLLAKGIPNSTARNSLKHNPTAPIARIQYETLDTLS